MAWFEKKDLTIEDKMALLFSERDRLAGEVSEATNRRIRQKAADLEIIRDFEAVIKELKELGIKY